MWRKPRSLALTFALGVGGACEEKTWLPPEPAEAPATIAVASAQLPAHPQRTPETAEARVALEQAKRDLKSKTHSRLAALATEMEQAREAARTTPVATRLRIQEMAQDMRVETAALRIDLDNSATLTPEAFARFEERIAIALSALQERAKAARTMIERDHAG